jgi:hypothetical protein
MSLEINRAALLHGWFPQISGHRFPKRPNEQAIRIHIEASQRLSDIS